MDTISKEIRWIGIITFALLLVTVFLVLMFGAREISMVIALLSVPAVFYCMIVAAQRKSLAHLLLAFGFCALVFSPASIWATVIAVMFNTAALFVTLRERGKI